MKMFGTLFFITTMLWVAFILIASTPVGRINRACLSVSWAGTAITTVGAIFSTNTESAIRDKANIVSNTCRFFIFRQFYAEEWAQQKAAAEAARQESPRETQ